uniref:Uncharacterized protein n=1 Tax=Panstrongylus lignarius TaxID=156445 RepID=A0A224Y5J9_9HEMI
MRKLMDKLCWWSSLMLERTLALRKSQFRELLSSGLLLLGFVPAPYEQMLLLHKLLHIIRVLAAHAALSLCRHPVTF